MGLFTLAAVCLPVAASAQNLLPGVQPWRPTDIDSTTIWLNEARALLEASTSPTLGDPELRAYGLLNRVTQVHFQELGPRGMAAAPVLHTALDSVGLRIEMTQDPTSPSFTLVHFLNPISDHFASLAYLYWFRGDELLAQPINLMGGRRPSLRVYWLGLPNAPYEAGLIHHEGEGIRRSPVISILRLAPNAGMWFPVQMGTDAIRLGGVGEAVWVDVNGDGIPEAASWTEYSPGAPFEFCDSPDCPHILSESLFARRQNGLFGLLKQQQLATPVHALVEFAQAIINEDDAAARAWSANAEAVEAAQGLGWPRIQGETAFSILRDREAGGGQDRIRVDAEIYFVNERGKWLISGVVQLGGQTGSQKGAGDPQGGGGGRP
jgi:hypothetical protein